jgi:hypothetical protein
MYFFPYICGTFYAVWFLGFLSKCFMPLLKKIRKKKERKEKSIFVSAKY